MKTIGFLILAFPFFFFLFFACSSEPATNKPENVLKQLSLADKSIDKQKLYTIETINTLNNAIAKGLVTKSEKNNLLNDLNRNIEWEILESKISGSKADVIIQYTDHPVENLIGFKMIYHFIAENGKWKIDLKNDLDDAITLVKKSDHSKYLKNISIKNTVK